MERSDFGFEFLRRIPWRFRTSLKDLEELGSSYLSCSLLGAVSYEGLLESILIVRSISDTRRLSPSLL